MWCSYSNVVIPKHATPCYKTLVPSVSATSLPRRRRKDISISTNHQQVGESGQTLVANLQSDTTPISKQEKQEGEQINGSDILLALQRASDRKNMKMKKKTNKPEEQGKKGKGSPSVATRMEESAVDYTNLRPLCINPNWAPKLDELEKRLRQLSDTI